ncbi:helix-turn-helix domain-containing protein [Niallia sp. Krafla_26]|uniref:helix-turn-helix domain-containing protein n=1 Tax=Niallia sp. Krafla_26 TaxID=3064703 RepID=UPI003D163918
MIGERLKRLRIQKGYSISKLSKLTGISKSYISYIERDLQNNPSYQILIKLADALDTSIDYLLGNAQNPNTPSPDEQITLDPEWTQILKSAIQDGLKKEELRNMHHFIKFKNGR